ncbi:unnamed protein product [Scytosiphon promiscuus]
MEENNFADSLRRKVSIVRQESAAEVMNLLASSGQGTTPNGDGGGNASTGMVDDEEGEEEEEEEAAAAAEGSQEVQTCIECEDQHAELVCLSCEEPFCRPCWGSLHRQGKRAEHPTQAVLGEVMPAPTVPDPPTAVPAAAVAEPPVAPAGDLNGDLDGGNSDSEELSDSDDGGADDGSSVSGGGVEYRDDQGRGEARALFGGRARKDKDKAKRHRKKRGSRKALGRLAVGLHGSSVLEESRFIPLRLDARERGLLAMLKGALNISEYTDRVDVYSGRWMSKAKKIDAELRFALQALSGMMFAGDRNWGQTNTALLDTLDENEEAFAEIFEVGRRYKITNPEKFRDFYGKMMFMLQDAQAQGRSGLKLVKDIQMVHDLVEDRGALELLKDDRIVAATADISGVSMSKAEVDQQVAVKREARAGLLKEYSSDLFPKKEVERVLDSIADANNYIAFNVAPVERTIDLLQQNFHPDKPEAEWSLKLTAGGGRKRWVFSSSSSSSMYGYGYGSSFSSGYGGGYGMSSMFGSSTAALSHDHRTQYTFVWQSLLLWSEAMRSMYRLWYFADSDLLSGKASYRLLNTGQGLNRVQQCPSVSQEMRRILRIVQSTCGPWVGLSVVHLGDRDVPNALVFIDKYTQIPRILNPVVEAVRSLEEMALDPVLGHYVDVGWGGVRNAKMAIFGNDMSHGWDGSGDDGGSCIDGRLTSAWNWCSLLPKKPFAPIFYLAGQYGFDGGWSSGLGE